MCKLQIIYLYSDYSGHEKDVRVLKFDCPTSFTYQQAYDIARQITENNENVYTNIVEEEQ